jgi:hypothetical protein
MESLLYMNADDSIEFINKQFSEFKGEYIVST